ncbi:MAG: hypothetical protein DI528_22245 [Shinella sp.]|nr:MAG: hypothetical protein DI528_22245 [Shinella sp.]
MNIKDFIEAMNASWPVALAVLLGAFGLLASESYGYEYLADLPKWGRGVIFAVGVFSGAVVAVRLLQWIGYVVSLPHRRWQRKKRIARDLQRLAELPSQEQRILYWAAQNNRQVFHCEFNNPPTEALVAKGLVIMIGGAHSVLEWPYSIVDHVWEEVRKDLNSRTDIPTIGNPFESHW